MIKHAKLPKRAAIKIEADCSPEQPPVKKIKISEKRFRNFQWTLFEHEDYPELILQLDTDECPLNLNELDLRWVGCQLECCPTSEKLHLQGSCYTKSLKTIQQLKKIFGFSHIHVEPLWHQTCIEHYEKYCSKAETHVRGPWEAGDRPQQGKRSDLDSVVKLVKDRQPITKIADQCSSSFIQYSRGICNLKHMLNVSPSNRDIDVTVLYGSPGSGKTKKAFSSCDNPYFVVMPADWWDGYDGQDTIIFDDFYGQVKISDMLRYLDRYPLQLPVKGGFTWAMWTKVYITSNTPPASWYQGHCTIPSEVYAALTRRITRVEHMTDVTDDDFTKPDPNIV